jgi:MFS family permease
VLGGIWLVIWAAIARPPFLPKSTHMTSKMEWPNFGERRVWALMFSYALPAISPGPVLTILAIYLVQRLHMTQADVNAVVWIPPLTWGIGYFFWGWAADRYAANNPRPIGMFMLLTIVSLTLGFVTMTTSVPVAIGLIGLSTFMGGGFQMVALKVGSYAFPREQSALMSGIASGSWSLVNFILLNAIGAGVTIAGVKILPGANLISTQRWEEIFWIIALMPLAGIAAWMVLSRNQTTAARA